MNISGEYGVIFTTEGNGGMYVGEYGVRYNTVIVVELNAHDCNVQCQMVTKRNGQSRQKGNQTRVS